MERPNLGGILGPHFTPVAGGASTFLQMYQTVVDLSTGSNVDLCFVLLSKATFQYNYYLIFFCSLNFNTLHLHSCT